jgi:hypothetical protein
MWPLQLQEFYYPEVALLGVLRVLLLALSVTSNVPDQKGVSKFYKYYPLVGQGADIASTLIAKQNGFHEANPVMQNDLAMIGSKAGLALLGNLLTRKLQNEHPKLAKTVSLITGSSGLTAAGLNTFNMSRK